MSFEIKKCPAYGGVLNSWWAAKISALHSVLHGLEGFLLYMYIEDLISVWPEMQWTV